VARVECRTCRTTALRSSVSTDIKHLPSEIAVASSEVRGGMLTKAACGCIEAAQRGKLAAEVDPPLGTYSDAHWKGW